MILSYTFWFCVVNILIYIWKPCLDIYYGDNLKTQWAGRKLGIFLMREIMQKQFKLVVQHCKMTKRKALYSRMQKKPNSYSSSLRQGNRGTMVWIIRASYSRKLSALVEVLQTFLVRGWRKEFCTISHCAEQEFAWKLCLTDWPLFPLWFVLLWNKSV